MKSVVVIINLLGREENHSLLLFFLDMFHLFLELLTNKLNNNNNNINRDMNEVYSPNFILHAFRNLSLNNSNKTQMINNDSFVQLLFRIIKEFNNINNNNSWLDLEIVEVSMLLLLSISLAIDDNNNLQTHLGRHLLLYVETLTQLTRVNDTTNTTIIITIIIIITLLQDRDCLTKHGKLAGRLVFLLILLLLLVLLLLLLLLLLL